MDNACAAFNNAFLQFSTEHAPLLCRPPGSAVALLCCGNSGLLAEDPWRPRRALLFAVLFLRDQPPAVGRNVPVFRRPSKYGLEGNAPGPIHTNKCLQRSQLTPNF